MPEIVVRGQALYKPTNVESRQYTEPLRDVPQSVTVVPRALIEEQNAVTLRDVLRNVPGISMQAGEGGGGPGGDFLSIRGFNARNDVYIDNIRDFGGYSRDPFNIEQVEVVKGPASSYTGRGSTGGSVNLVSKAPLLDSSFYQFDAGHRDRRVQALHGRYQPGTDPAVGRPRRWKPMGRAKTKVVITEPFLKTSLRLNAMWTEGDVSNRNEVDYSRWGIAPSLALRVRPRCDADAELFSPRTRQRAGLRHSVGAGDAGGVAAELLEQAVAGGLRQFLRPARSRQREDQHRHRHAALRAEGRRFVQPAEHRALRPDAPRFDHDRAALHPGRDRPERGDQPSIPGARSDRHDPRGAVRCALQLRDLWA